MHRTASASAVLVLALAALPAAVLSFSALPAQAEEGAALTVAFKDIQTPSGVMMIALFDSQDSYDKGGKPVHAARVPVTSAVAETKVAGLKPGRYAIKAFHDVDGDGKMGTNPFGIPLEPFAFSNNAKGSMGPASWAAASFDVPAAGAVQTIQID